MVRHGKGVLVAAMAVVCAIAVGIPAQAFDNRVQFVRGQGSDSTYDIMQELDKAFNNANGCLTTPSTGDSPFDSSCVAPGTTTQENNDHDIGISYFPVGSSNGVKILERFGQPFVTKIDYARSSRARRASDNSGLRFVAFAGDATPWVNFREGPGDENSPAAGVDDLTLEQIRDIWLDCTITNWNQVGGQTAPILVWTSQAGSGERASFDTFIGGNSENCIATAHKDNNLTNGERVVFENSSNPIRTCTTYAGGSCPAEGWKQSIFHTGFGAYQAFPDGPFGKADGADLGMIEGVAVSAATIADGTYLANRLVYNAYRKSFPTNNVVEATYEYMSEAGWICKPNSAHTTNPRTGVNYGLEITEIISDVGFVPLSEATIAGDQGPLLSKCRIS